MTSPAGAQDLVVTRWGARYRGRRLPCAIGRGGITGDKREGDGATPAGIYPFAGFRILHRPDRLALGASRPIRPADIWSDDPADPAYNRPGRAPSRYSHERLWRADPLYDLVIDIGQNGAPPQPGHGSAIFIHRWRKPRHPTEGCIAFAPRDLAWIAAWITSPAGRRDRLVIRA